MTKESNTDNLLRTELSNIRDDKRFVDYVMSFLISDEDKEKLLYYIQNESNDRKDVLLMTAVIGIENGQAEGEVEIVD